MTNKILITFISLLIFCCASQEKLFYEMKTRDGYSNFIKSGWVTFRNYKCFSDSQLKQEYFAVDINGNPVIIVTCCNFWLCYAEIFTNKRI